MHTCFFVARRSNSFRAAQSPAGEWRANRRRNREGEERGEIRWERWRGRWRWENREEMEWNKMEGGQRVREKKRER